MSKGNTPRRKKLSKAQRLKSGTEWLQSYSGKNIVKGYSKWYGVDKLCAIKELRNLGVQISGEYEEQIKKSIQDIANARKLRKEKREKEISFELESCGDETFAFIAGYTSNDVPFGITRKEWAEMDDERRQNKVSSQSRFYKNICNSFENFYWKLSRIRDEY